MNRKVLSTTLLAALVLAACGQEADGGMLPEPNELPDHELNVLPPEPEFVEPVLRETVTVFDPYEAQHFGILPNKLVVPVEGNETLLLVEPGHVLASKYLFFRKVTAVERDGDFLVFDTVEAHITDAVLQGTFDLKIVGEIDHQTGAIAFYDDAENPFLRPGVEAPVAAPVEDETPFGQGHYKLSYEFDRTWGSPINLVAAAGITFPNRWYNLDGAGRLKVMPVLNSTFSPSIKVQGKVSCCENFNLANPFGSLNPKVDYVRVIAEGRLELEAGMKIKATAASSGQLDVMVVGQSGALATINCFQAGGSIGILPVTARICPSMRFQGSYKVDGAMDLEAKVDIVKTVGAGIIMENGNWRTYFNDDSAQITPFVSRDIQFTLEANATVTPKIEADISGILGGAVEVNATASLNSRCVAPNMSHVLAASIGGKASAYFGPLNLLVINIDKKEKEWQLFQRNWPNLWSSTAGTCVPSYATMSYQPVRATPDDVDNLRTLDLDMVVEVPAENAGGAAQKISTDSRIRTIPGSGDTYPYVSFGGANAAGRPETANFTRFVDGTYKIWAHDYENAASPIDSFGRSSARVTMWIGNGQLRTVTAPRSTGNVWNIATFTRTTNNGASQVNLTVQNTIESRNVYAP